MSYHNLLHTLQLDHAYCEMNKRISEHDQAVVDGFDRPEITLQVFILLDFSLTVKAVPHECEIRTSQP